MEWPRFGKQGVASVHHPLKIRVVVIAVQHFGLYGAIAVLQCNRRAKGVSRLAGKAGTAQLGDIP